MTPQKVLLLVVQVSIFLTVFGFGLQSTLDDLLYLLRRPGLLVRSVVAMFVVMPLFALLLAWLFDLHRAVEIALIAIAISPVPPLLPRRERQAGGHSEYGLGLMVAVSLIAIVLIPLDLNILGRITGQPLSISPGAVAKVVLISVLVPLAAGVLFHALAPGPSVRISTVVALNANVLLGLSALLILVGAMPVAISLIGNGTILVIAAFVVVGLAVGHYLGGPDEDDRVVLALSTACRHPALAIAIAVATFPDEKRVVGAVVLYLLLNVIVAIPYVRRRPRRAPG